MTDFPASHRDLLDSQIGILSTVGRSGIPQSTPIWFLYDEGELHSWLSDARQKVKNLMERPECSFVIIDPANPFRYLAVRGHAELALDPDNAFCDKMSAKYGRDLREMLVEGETRYKISFLPSRPPTAWPPAEH